MHKLTGRQGFETSAHLINIRRINTLFSVVASWLKMEALSGEPVPLYNTITKCLCKTVKPPYCHIDTGSGTVHLLIKKN